MLKIIESSKGWGHFYLLFEWFFQKMIAET